MEYFNWLEQEAEEQRRGEHAERVERFLPQRLLTKKFICVDCGKLFASLAPPAETCEDDPQPQCSTCIEKDLENYDEGPLDDETVERIIAEVLKRGTR